MSQPLYLTGTIVVGDGAELDECWVVDGRLTLDPPDEPAQQLEGWVLPGLVDVHCHIGLGPQGAVSAAIRSSSQGGISRGRYWSISCAVSSKMPRLAAFSNAGIASSPMSGARAYQSPSTSSTGFEPVGVCSEDSTL